MRRKIVSLLLCGVMACSMLVGCGNSDDIDKDEVNTTAKEESIHTLSDKGKEKTAVEKPKDDEKTVEVETADTTILDVVKYVDGNDNEMCKNGIAYLKEKGLTYEGDEHEVISTLSDEFLGYRAYYNWDSDDYRIALTFDSEDELKQAVVDVRNYLSAKADEDFEESQLREYASNFFYDNAEVFCIKYEQESEKAYYALFGFKVCGGLSQLRAESEAGFILGECESYIEIGCFRAFDEDAYYTYFSKLGEETVREEIEVTEVDEDAYYTYFSKLDEESVQEEAEFQDVSSEENHDYIVSLENITSHDFDRDNYFSLRALCNLYDNYTRDPANSPNSFSYEVSDDCTLMYFNESISDVDDFSSKLSEERIALLTMRMDGLDIGDAIGLRVVVEAGKIVFMEIGYDSDLAN